MTYQELEARVLQLTPAERLRLLEQISRSLRQEIDPQQQDADTEVLHNTSQVLDRAAIVAEAARLLQIDVPADSALYRVLGSGGKASQSLSDAEAKELYTDYLIRKYLH
jgi:predicted proteasome-type protease